MQKNERLNHKHLYHQPQHFERYASGPVLHRLTVNSTGMQKAIGKPVDLPQRFGLLHNGNGIDKRLVFWCYFTIANVTTQYQIQWSKINGETFMRKYMTTQPDEVRYK